MILDLIAMFIVGILLGICLTMIIVLRYCWRDEYPTDEDLDQMFLWYDDVYKEDDNAK